MGYKAYGSFLNVAAVDGDLCCCTPDDRHPWIEVINIVGPLLHLGHCILVGISVMVLKRFLIGVPILGESLMMVSLL